MKSFLTRSLVLSSIWMLMLSVVWGGSASVFAQEEANRTITISPLLQDVQLEAGERYERKIEVHNLNAIAYQVEVEVRDIEIAQDSHNIQFLPEESVQNRRRSLAAWVEPISSFSFTLDAGQKTDTTFAIVVPEGVDSDDYFAAINFYYSPLGKAPSSATVQIRQSIGSLLLASVGGTESAAQGDQYWVSEMQVDPNGEVVDVAVDFENDSLRYMHLRPQVTLVDAQEEVLFQALGEVVRVFPGERSRVGHVFPKGYLDSRDQLFVRYVLADRFAERFYYEAEAELETAYVARGFFSGGIVPLLAGLLVLASAVLLALIGWKLRSRSKK